MKKDAQTFHLLRKKSQGFTLIELMIVVTIVAILASIALPSYRDYVTRSRIAEATSALAAKRAAIEQFYDNSRTYVGASNSICNDTTTSQSFTFTCSNQSTTAYTITATGTGTMAGFGFSIDQANLRQTTAVPTGWSQPDPNTCWITRKGGIC